MVVARKRFGQNFLQDQDVIERIVRAALIPPQANIIEIGPGRGALTQKLLEFVSRLTVIEIDRDLFSKLKNLKHSDKITGICQDVLQIDFSTFGEQLYIIGNLPYNISTPLLFHLLQYRAQIHSMIFMLQKEVVDRIFAQPKDSNFGRLSVIFQYYYELEYLFTVSPQAFNPIPKVESAVFALHPKKQTESVHLADLEFLVGQTFAMRRKTIYNNLKHLFLPQDWQILNIDPKRRPQDLSIPEFIQLTQHYHSHYK